MNPLKLGVLGVSSHYGLCLRHPLAHSPLVELTALGSRNLAKAQAAAAEWGFTKAYGSYEEVLGDPEVEAVYIPLPNDVHAEWIRKCADAGKAVICEKPIALDSGEAKAALDYAESKGVMAMEAFMYRFHPQWVRAKELIDCGEIGQVKAIHTMFCYKNNDPTNIRNIKEVGGGALLDIGCYAISSSRFLLGAEPVRVVADIDYDPEGGTDTFAFALMDFGDVRTQFTVSTRLATRQKVTVYGTGGQLTVVLPFNAFPDVPLTVVVNNGVNTREIKCGPADQYALMFEAFVKAYRGGGGAPIPASDAVANMKVIDAVFRSGESGGWVDI